MGSHYSYGTHPANLARWANDARKLLIKRINTNNYKNAPYNIVLVYRGFSGASLGTALMLNIQAYFNRIKSENSVEVIYCRKPNESDHNGRLMENSRNIPFVSNNIYVAVDDFIETGTTIIEMNTCLNNYRKKYTTLKKIIKFDYLCLMYIPDYKQTSTLNKLMSIKKLNECNVVAPYTFACGAPHT
jgi:hypothetical protein